MLSEFLVGLRIFKDKFRSACHKWVVGQEMEKMRRKDEVKRVDGVRRIRVIVARRRNGKP